MNPSEIIVSIIIPVFNRAHLIGETLESIINQTYHNWECLLVDDGSTDNTIEIVKDFEKKDNRIKIYSRPEHKLKGANSCRNYGFQKSRGDFILFLDSDDLLKATCIQNRLKILNNTKGISFVIAETSYYNGKIFSETAIFSFSEGTTAKMYLQYFLKYQIPWSIMSVLWKRSTIKTVKFDENLERLQDVDFHIRVLLQNDLKCSKLNEVDNYYRSIKGKTEDENYQKVAVEGASKVIKKLLQTNLLNTEQLTAFRQFILFFNFNYFYPNQHLYNQKVSEVELAIKKANIFSNRELQLLKVYKVLIKFNLHKLKGFGVNRLTKSIKNALKYE